jgi:hypothetical protein
LKWFLHGFSSNEHIVQKPFSEMYTSHFEHVWSSVFKQQKNKKQQIYSILPNIFYKNFSFISSCVFSGHVYCIHFGFVCYTRFYSWWWHLIPIT